MDSDPAADRRVARLRERLQALDPVDERERVSVARTLAELERLPRPFDRDDDPVHVTASAIVSGPRGILLHHHKRLAMWLQPGGHVDGDEEPEEAALRETAEETGVAAHHPHGGPEIVHVDVHDVPNGHTHLDVRYLVHAGDVDPAPAVGESPHVAWFPFDRALAVADPGLVGALAALRRRGLVA